MVEVLVVCSVLLKCIQNVVSDCRRHARRYEAMEMWIRRRIMRK